MTMARLLLYGCVIGLVFYWAYDMGGERVAARNAALQQQLDQVADDNRRLREETDAAIRVRADAEEKLAEARRRYRADVPTGVERDLMRAVRLRLEGGVPSERLAQVIGAAQIDPGCAPEVITRRFLVQTPFSSGANAAVTFAGNAITVTGSGERARDAAGNPEQWFDPAAPVRIAFTAPGGAQSVAEGLLPLHHAVAIGDRAHNFTIAAADTRGFVNVTEQVCDYP